VAATVQSGANTVAASLAWSILTVAFCLALVALGFFVGAAAARTGNDRFEALLRNAAEWFRKLSERAKGGAVAETTRRSAGDRGKEPPRAQEPAGAGRPAQAKNPPLSAPRKRAGRTRVRPSRLVFRKFRRNRRFSASRRAGLERKKPR